MVKVRTNREEAEKAINELPPEKRSSAKQMLDAFTKNVEDVVRPWTEYTMEAIKEAKENDTEEDFNKVVELMAAMTHAIATNLLVNQMGFDKERFLKELDITIDQVNHARFTGKFRPLN